MHSFNANRSCCNCRALSWLTIGQKILISSANNNDEDFYHTHNVINIYVRKRSGPITEPCGTPLKTLLVADFTPLTTTICERNDLAIP